MKGTKFQTEVIIPEFPWKTGYEKKNLFMGSCFTENIGNKMAQLKYETDINPFGILYNPVSVANGIDLLLNKHYLQKDDLVQHNNLWHSFYHHGRFSSPDPDAALQLINERIASSSDFLKQAEFLFVTFGTAWIYKFKKTGRTVANCHKIPANEFERQKSDVNEIVEIYDQKLNELWKFNPDLKIVFTISPIRHWKDGPVENQRSKSALILAVEKIIKKFDEKKCGYFPSYEIVMDELRDYRFYADDMIHLSDTAVNYIWEQFQEKLIEPGSLKISKQVQKINSLVNHKPINRFTTENLNFLNQTLKKTDELNRKYPFLKFEHEKKYLQNQIQKIDENQK